jgi:hypothetical protein
VLPLQGLLVARRGGDAAWSKPLRGTRVRLNAERFIAALRRKIEHSRHPERLATPDKTR